MSAECGQCGRCGLEKIETIYNIVHQNKGGKEYFEIILESKESDEKKLEQLIQGKAERNKTKII